MLSLQRFNIANQDLQASETHLKGEHVYTHILEEGGIILYSYNDFLIEVHYNANFQTVEKYIAITMDDAADKYISTDELLGELV